ncbi:hypothetical protein ScPMuIL_010112 [Solemya velum]
MTSIYTRSQVNGDSPADPDKLVRVAISTHKAFQTRRVNNNLSVYLMAFGRIHFQVFSYSIELKMVMIYFGLLALTSSCLATDQTLVCSSEKFEYYDSQSPVCLGCDNCLPGKGRNKYGRVDQSPRGALTCAKCEACKPGFFNDKQALTCKPCTNCGSRNMFPEKECSATADTVCSKWKPPITTPESSPESVTAVVQLENNYQESIHKDIGEGDSIIWSILGAVGCVCVLCLGGLLFLGWKVYHKKPVCPGYGRVSQDIVESRDTETSDMSKDNKQSIVPTSGPSDADHITTSVSDDETRLKEVDVTNTYQPDNQYATLSRDQNHEVDESILEIENETKVNEEYRSEIAHDLRDNYTKKHLQSCVYENEVDTDASDGEFLETDARPETILLPDDQVRHKHSRSSLRRHRSFPLENGDRKNLVPILAGMTTIGKQSPGLQQRTAIEPEQRNDREPKIPNRVPGVSELQFIAERFIKHYKDFARNEGMKKHELDIIIADNTGEKERCYKVLEKWTEIKGKEATLPSLCNAIREVKMLLGLSILILFWLATARGLMCSSSKFEFYDVYSPTRCLKCDNCVPGKGRDSNANVPQTPNGAQTCAPCEDCKFGFYNDKQGLTCKRCKDCSSRNRYTKKPCTATANTKCSRREAPREPQAVLDRNGIRDVHDTFSFDATHTETPKEDTSKNNVLVWPIVLLVVGCLIVGALGVLTVYYNRTAIVYTLLNHYSFLQRRPVATVPEDDVEQGAAQCSKIPRTIDGEKNGTAIHDPDETTLKECVETVAKTRSITTHTDIPKSDDHTCTTDTPFLKRDGNKEYDNMHPMPRAYEQEGDTSRSVGECRSLETDAVQDETSQLLEDRQRKQIQSEYPNGRINWDRKPTGRELAFIAERSAKIYKNFSRHENIPEHELEAIEANEKLVADRAFEVLKKWTEYKGESATLNSLNIVIRNIGRPDIMEELNMINWNPT